VINGEYVFTPAGYVQEGETDDWSNVPFTSISDIDFRPFCGLSEIVSQIPEQMHRIQKNDWNDLKSSLNQVLSILQQLQEQMIFIL